MNEGALRLRWRVAAMLLSLAALAPATSSDAADTGAGVPRTYRLGADDIAALDAAEMLRPLVGIEYPNESLLRAALSQVRCSRFLVTLLEIDPTLLTDPRISAGLCRVVQQAGATADSTRDLYLRLQQAGATADSMRDLYLQQLPPELEERIVRQVRRLHAPEHVATTAWRATEGCGCAPDKFVLGEEVHGLAPYWGTAAGREIDFGVIMRLSYLGVVLDDDAALVMPEAVARQGAELARVAHRHNASTNLVIFRRDWDGLLGRTPEQLRNFSQTAARRAVALLDTAAPADPDDRLQPLLLPFLREPAWAWDGITVFFDDVPATTGAGGDAYGRFFASFVADLTEAMQRSGRAYRLNIVLPAQALDEQGSYNFARLMKIKKSAERPQADPGAYAKVRTGYTGTSDIVVNFAVLLPEPTDESKKALRARLDASDTVKGMDRDVLLRSLLPLLLPHAPTPPPWPLETPEMQLDDDLAYAKWNFGGVALWGPPGGPGDATTMAQVGEYFRPEREVLDGLCRWVCPNRVALRLALQAGVAVGAIALGVCWLRAPPSRRRRAVGRVGLWVGGVPTLALAAALLKCDPLLAPWKPGTPSLLALLLLLILAGGVAVIRRRKARR